MQLVLNKKVYLFCARITPAILILFCISYWTLLGYDVHKQVLLTVISTILLAIIGIIMIFNSSSKLIRKDGSDLDYGEIRNKVILNLALFILSVVGIILCTKYANGLGRNEYIDISDTIVFFECFLLLTTTRCYLGFMLFPEIVIVFSQNILRCITVLAVFILPHTWYSFISIMPTLNAVVLSIAFDTLINKGYELYLTKNY